MKKTKKRTIKCEKCPALFSKKEYMKKHVEMAHSVTAEESQSEVLEISEGNLENLSKVKFWSGEH